MPDTIARTMIFQRISLSNEWILSSNSQIQPRMKVTENDLTLKM